MKINIFPYFVSALLILITAFLTLVTAFAARSGNQIEGSSVGGQTGEKIYARVLLPTRDSSVSGQNGEKNFAIVLIPKRTLRDSANSPTQMALAIPTEAPVQNNPMRTVFSVPTEAPVQNNPMRTVSSAPTEAPVQNNPALTISSAPTEAPVQNNPALTISSAPTDAPVQNKPMLTAPLAAKPVSVPAASGIRVMRVEYANYANSRGEVSSWEQKMTASGINMVALAAGRVEWTYFKWAGHQSNWSNDVTSSGVDMLADDSARYGQTAAINAVIDVFAPNYVSAHPDKAAINVLGQRSPNLVSTAELVHGAFGQSLLDMVAYIAANYPNVSSISITELSYRVDGYGPDDLALYSAATGQSDWPRQSNGQVDIDDPSIGNWRSAALGEFLGRATALAHQYGKKLFMDVSVSYGNLSLMTNNKGTNYKVMLQNVDKIVVWDYFGEMGFAPEYSRDIAAYLTQFGNNRVILSIGLWGASGTTVTATDFDTAIQSAQAGGMPNLWICPGSMLSAYHWQVLQNLWGIG